MSKLLHVLSSRRHGSGGDGGGDASAAVETELQEMNSTLTTIADVDIATATTTATSSTFDLSPDEYFRLYEDISADVGDDDDEVGNILVGILSPYEYSNHTSNFTSAAVAAAYDVATSSNVSSIPAILVENSLTAMNATTTTTTWSTPIELNKNVNASHIFTNVAQLVTSPTHVSNSSTNFNSSSSPSSLSLPSLVSTSFTAAETVSLSATVPANQNNNNSNNYGDDFDIALIDSVETALGDDTDYGAMGFNGGTGGAGAVGGDSDNGLIQQSIAYAAHEVSNKHNTTFGQRNYENGGGVVSGRIGSYGTYGSRDIVDSTDIANDKVYSGGGNGVNSNGGGSNFMMLLEDFGEYFYNFNNSGTAIPGTGTINNLNLTDIDFRTNCTNSTSASCFDLKEAEHNYWALILMIFPILTLFGNILVILSVCRERSLQTVTNYFIVSLAIADLLVAVVVMPFAVYVLFNGIWALPNFVCDFYIAMDVICSTSSIFNLVAISIDRYIAVTQPIKYAKHKNSRRVCLTILFVWAISAAIGSPIVLGLNNTPNRDPDLCVFYNTDFILYSSLSSFYIPCIIMVFLYWNIFKALRVRARKQRAARKPNLSELTGGSVIENIAQTRRLAETALDSTKHASRIIPDETATNTASGSNEEEGDNEDENAISPDIDDCHVIVNDKSTEFMLATVVEETGNVVAQISHTQPHHQLMVADPNGNHDSGYAPSNVDDVLTGAADSSPPDSPVLPSGTMLQRASVSSTSRRDTGVESSPKREPALSVAMKPLSFVRYGVQEAMTLARNDSTLSTTSKTSTRKDKKNSQASRFTIYKVHKASKKKREKSSAKKERKATKTLAIVLGVFLFCWLPFFSCNIMDAMCAKFNKDCRPGVTAFILTTWLGYINSFVNPVIYTIFNPEFRKAFKKIMHMG